MLAFAISKIPDFTWEWSIRAFLAHFGLGFIAAFLFYFYYKALYFQFCQQRNFSLDKALRVAAIGAIVSIVIDFDHIVLLFGRAYGRPAHKPVALVSLFVAVFCSVYLCFFLFKSIFRLPLNYNRAEKCLCWLVWSLCLILHVVEDYTLGWF